MLRIVLLVVLILMLVGTLPVWSFSSGWGYTPVGGLGLVLVIALLVMFSGRSKV